MTSDTLSFLSGEWKKQENTVKKRRKYDRFRIRGSAYVVYSKPRRMRLGKEKFVKLGPVADISRGGLSVEYVPRKSCRWNKTELSVFIPGQGIILNRIPSRIIQNRAVAELDQGKAIMHCNIEFRELNQHQLFRLRRFVRDNTSKTSLDRRKNKERRYLTSPDDPFFSISGWEHDKGRRTGRERRGGFNLDIINDIPLINERQAG